MIFGGPFYKDARLPSCTGVGEDEGLEMASSQTVVGKSQTVMTIFVSTGRVGKGGGLQHRTEIALVGTGTRSGLGQASGRYSCRPWTGKRDSKGQGRGELGPGCRIQLKPRLGNRRL